MAAGDVEGQRRKLHQALVEIEDKSTLEIGNFGFRKSFTL
jgi:hypothetical protein